MTRRLSPESTGGGTTVVATVPADPAPQPLAPPVPGTLAEVAT